MRWSTLLSLGVALLLGTGSLASVAGQAAAQAPASPIRLVVVLLGGVGTASNDGTFASIAPALEQAGTAPQVNLAISVEPFSYRYPEMTYTRCDTNSSIRDSAARLNQQVRDLAERHPEARFLLVGHSLGGVIATHWAAVDAPRELLARTSGVVTLNSPLQGITDVPAEIADLVTRWATAALCNDRRVLEELTPGRGDGPLAALGRAPEALAASGGRLYAGASRGDIPISWRSATLPGAETRYFDSGVCPDWSSLAASTPGLAPDFRSTDWSRVRMQLASLPAQVQQSLINRLASCVDVSHGNVLRDPAAIDWLVGIAQAALAAPPPSPAPVAPAEQPPRRQHPH